MCSSFQTVSLLLYLFRLPGAKQITTFRPHVQNSPQKQGTDCVLRKGRQIIFGKTVQYVLKSCHWSDFSMKRPPKEIGLISQWIGCLDLLLYLCREGVQVANLDRWRDHKRKLVFGRTCSPSISFTLTISNWNLTIGYSTDQKWSQSSIL